MSQIEGSEAHKAPTFSSKTHSPLTTGGKVSCAGHSEDDVVGEVDLRAVHSQGKESCVTVSAKSPRGLTGPSHSYASEQLKVLK